MPCHTAYHRNEYLNSISSPSSSSSSSLVVVIINVPRVYLLLWLGSATMLYTKYVNIMPKCTVGLFWALSHCFGYASIFFLLLITALWLLLLLLLLAVLLYANAMPFSVPSLRRARSRTKCGDRAIYIWVWFLPVEMIRFIQMHKQNTHTIPSPFEHDCISHSRSRVCTSTVCRWR